MEDQQDQSSGLDVPFTTGSENKRILHLPAWNRDFREQQPGETAQGSEPPGQPLMDCARSSVNWATVAAFGFRSH